MATEPKEGVDFEWVEVKNSGGTAKTRRFFTAKEKKAKSQPQETEKTKPAEKAKPASSVRPKPRPPAKKEEAPKKTGLSFGDIKATKSAPRSMGKSDEEVPAEVKKASVDGAGTLLAGGALTAAAIAARKKARTSVTTPIKKAPEAPKTKGTIDPSRRKLLGLRPKPTETPVKPKATVTAPAAKGKKGRGSGGRAAGSAVGPKLGGGSGRFEFDPFNVLNKGGMVKKKKC